MVFAFHHSIPSNETVMDQINVFANVHVCQLEKAEQHGKVSWIIPFDGTHKGTINVKNLR